MAQQKREEDRKRIEEERKQQLERERLREEQELKEREARLVSRHLLVCGCRLVASCVSKINVEVEVVLVGLG